MTELQPTVEATERCFCAADGETFREGAEDRSFFSSHGSLQIKPQEWLFRKMSEF